MKKLTIILGVILLPLILSAQTIEQVEKELIRQDIPCHKIVLAQARLETGNFKSDRCKKDHNLFGIKHDGKYAKYRNWRESIADYKKRISSRYTGGNYYSFLVKIKYASDEKYIHKLKQFSMCLIKKRRLPKISRKPITVYKIIERYNNFYMTPVREEYINLNSTLKAKDTSIYEMYCSSVIKGCGVHAYINLEKAQEVMETYYRRFHYIILKCVIPPNTYFWEGKGGDIAARELEISNVSISISYESI